MYLAGSDVLRSFRGRLFGETDSQQLADVVEKPGGRAAASREQGCFSRIFVLIGSGEAVFLGYFTQFHVRRAQYSRQ